EALPPAITPLKLLPGDWEDYFDMRLDVPTQKSYTHGIPLLAIDREEKATIQEWVSIGPGYGGQQSAIFKWWPDDPQRLAFYEIAVDGDSSGGIALVFPDDLALLSVYTTDHTGPLLPHYLTGIESARLSLGSSFEFQYVDLSGYAIS